MSDRLYSTVPRTDYLVTGTGYCNSR